MTLLNWILGIQISQENTTYAVLEINPATGLTMIEEGFGGIDIGGKRRIQGALP